MKITFTHKGGPAVVTEKPESIGPCDEVLSVQVEQADLDSEGYANLNHLLHQFVYPRMKNQTGPTFMSPAPFATGMAAIAELDEQTRKTAGLKPEAMTATGVAMLQEQERAAGAMACKQCGRLLIFEQKITAYICLNCGNDIPPHLYPPIENDELDHAAKQIASFASYERPIIMQEMYRLLFMVKRARRAKPNYALGYDEGYQAGYEAGRANGVEAGRQSVHVTIERRNSADEEFQTAVREEVVRARKKFPSPNATMPIDDAVAWSRSSDHKGRGRRNS